MEGPNDWTGQAIPTSCCHAYEGIPNSGVNNWCIGQGKGKYLAEVGCYDRLKIKVNSNSSVLIGIGIGIAFVEVIIINHFLKNQLI